MELSNDQKPPLFNPSKNITQNQESPSSSIELAQKREVPTKASKEDQTHQKQRNPDLILDLSLCSNEFEDDYDQKIDLIDRFSVGNTKNPNPTPQASYDGEPRVFSCNYCQRKFYSSQALGGHQNAHKRERTLAKRGHRMASSTYGSFLPEHFYKGRPLTTSSSTTTTTSTTSSQSCYPSNISALPLYGLYYKHNSHNNNNIISRPLGIQAHSLIHKPPHHGGSRLAMIDQHPTIGRLTMSSPTSSSSSSLINGGMIARFDSVHQKNSQPLDRNISGVCWKDSVNVLKSSHKQDYDQLHKLDLSLKL